MNRISAGLAIGIMTRTISSDICNDKFCLGYPTSDFAEREWTK